MKIITKTLKKTSAILAFLLTINSFAFGQNKPIELEKKWELAGLNNPESVIYDETNNVLYVSNVNGNPTDKDNNGFISKVSTEGKIINLKWIEGLNAPKGMAIVNGKLYVADINAIVEIDIKEGKKLNSFTAEGSTFLNDVTADEDGNVYVSNTFGFSAIYKLNSKGVRKLEIYIKDEALQMPNGLLIDGKNLIVAPWGKEFDPNTYKTKIPGSLLNISLKDKTISILSKPIGNLDGLEKMENGYLVSDWQDGKIYYWSAATETMELMDLPQGSADIEFDSKSKTIFVPLMNDNKMAAYTVKK